MRRLMISGDGGPVAHELTDELITIGRSPENAIQLSDPSVSSRHAQLQLTGDSYELRDVGSTNGTRVNGEAITAVLLRPGDQIRFGGLEACFDCEIAGAAPPPPAPAPVEAAALPAEVSARPADFGNASPFQKRSKEKDPTRLAIYAAAGLAVAALIASMLALAQMQAPPLP
ncbi:MAG: FHA domain-containing protein [Verrucomicrobiota bacterium]|nr:FHA domain-containing protein [Verrucomicrobiota bacterium]